MPDESDRKFYEIAKHLNIPLVTGNKKHFPINELVISPSEYLGRFQINN
jgi:hypothetical protein